LLAEVPLVLIENLPKSVAAEDTVSCQRKQR